MYMYVAHCIKVHFSAVPEIFQLQLMSVAHKRGSDPESEYG